MAASKYFVWGEGVWRELDVSSGRVSGWRRRARFVFVRRGRLQVARRRAVLRALQALATGQPGSAADGPRLAHGSKSSVRVPKSRAIAAPAPPAPPAPAPPAPPAPTLTPAPAPAPAPATITPAVLHAWEHHHCCAHYNGCITNVREARPAPASAAHARCEAATQCASAERGLTINVASTPRSSGEEFATPRAVGRARARASSRSRGKPRAAHTELQDLLRAPPAPPSSPARRPRASSTDDTAENKGAARPASRDKKPKPAERKEAVRRSLRTRSVAERVNDVDTSSERAAHAPQKRAPPPAPLAPPPAPLPPPAPCDARRPSPGPHIISKRPSASHLKEYSNLEDHAIVAWLASGARASHVNGNLVWKQLQEQFQRLAGTWRSWHSLRNRYLRYILPALGSLGLPQAEVSRLRAAAATGCSKTARAATARRASIFKEQAVRSASSRRPPAPPASPPPATPSPEPPSPRSSSPPSPRSASPPSQHATPTPPPAPSSLSSSSSSAEPPPPAPSSSSSSSSGAEPPPPAPSSSSSSSSSSGAEPPPSPSVSPVLNGSGLLSTKRRSLRLAREQDSVKKPVAREQDNARKAKRRSPRYSEVTRRFASRQRAIVISSGSSDSDSSAEGGTAQARPPHTRKLFNPNNKL